MSAAIIIDSYILHDRRQRALILLYKYVQAGASMPFATAEDILSLCASSLEDTGPEHRKALWEGMVKGDKSALVAVGIALLQAGAQEG